MPLRVPPQPRRVYANNPLKLVICQIRHPVNVRFDEPGFAVPAKDLLGDEYPRVTQERQVTFPFIIGGAGAASAPSAQEAFWRFQDADATWSIAIARAFITLETTRYRKYEEFESRLLRVLDVLDALGVTFRERLGVRYINEIRHPDATSPTAWRKYLNPKVLGMIGGEELGDDVIVAAQDIRLREPDGVFIIKHGYVGADSSPDGVPTYQIDLDLADEDPVKFDRNQTTKQIQGFHERIKNVFELSITDALRDYLVVEEVLNDPGRET